MLVERDVGWSLVTFAADWCQACQGLKPILDEIAREWRGRVAVVEIDVEKEPEIARRRGVRGLPLLLLCEGERERARLAGRQSKRAVEEMLQRYVGS